MSTAEAGLAVIIPDWSPTLTNCVRPVYHESRGPLRGRREEA